MQNVLPQLDKPIFTVWMDRKVGSTVQLSGSCSEEELLSADILKLFKKKVSLSCTEEHMYLAIFEHNLVSEEEFENIYRNISF